MLAQIEQAARLLGPALAGALATGAVRALRRATGTPSSAVYIAWDTHGRCRYVGSVRRPQARAAVRDRLNEHLTEDDRHKAVWYALTVLPLRPDLDLEAVRLCEGWVAYLLHPSGGSAHPVIVPDRPPEVAFAA